MVGAGVGFEGGVKLRAGGFLKIPRAKAREGLGKARRCKAGMQTAQPSRYSAPRPRLQARCRRCQLGVMLATRSWK